MDILQCTLVQESEMSSVFGISHRNKAERFIDENSVIITTHHGDYTRIKVPIFATVMTLERKYRHATNQMLFYCLLIDLSEQHTEKILVLLKR